MDPQLRTELRLTRRVSTVITDEEVVIKGIPLIHITTKDVVEEFEAIDQSE